jgi:rhodanese-related sulfurtransferase
MKKVQFLFLLLLVGILSGCGPSSEELWARKAIRAKVDSRATIVDVRTPEEFRAGHIKGALNIPHTEIRQRVGELGNDFAAPIVVYCGKGGRADTAQRILTEEGFTNVWNLGSYRNLIEKQPDLIEG